MPFLFFLDSGAYGFSAALSAALALMVLGFGPRRALNQLFALFTLLEAFWALTSLLLRVALWQPLGSAALMLELSTLAFAFAGPVLLMFASRYVGRRPRWYDLAAMLGLVAIAGLSVPLFGHALVFEPELTAQGTVRYGVGPFGFAAAILPALYMAWSAALFWQERRRIREPFLALSIVILLAGFLGGGLFNPPFPVMSLTTTLSVVVLAYGVVSRDIFNPLREKTAELAALQQIGLELAAQLDLDALLRSIVSRAVELLRATSGGLYLYRPGRDVLEWVLAVGREAQPVGTVLRRGEGLSGRVWESGRAMIVEDYQHWEGRVAAFDRYAWGSLVSVPISWGDEFVGVLNVEGAAPRVFSPADAEMLSLFASQAAIAIRNVRLYEASRRRAERLALVNRISQAVRATLRLDDLLEAVYQEIISIFQADSFFIALYDEERGDLDFRIQVDEGTRQPAERQAAGVGLTSLVVAQKQPVLIRHMDEEKEHLPSPMLWGSMKLPQSWLGVPMLIGERLIGVISVQSYTAHAYGEEEQLLLATITDQVAVAVEQARLYQSLQDSEKKYHTLFAQANDAVFLLTPEGRILDANQKACQLLGYDCQQLLQVPMADLLAEGRGRFPHSAQQLSRPGMHIETEQVRKDGTRVPVEVSAAVLTVAGQMLILAQVRDISERKRAEEQLRQAQKMEAVGTLAGGIAHDFNNMLTGILGYASVARQDVPAGSSVHADLGQIIEVAGQAADLTRQLLTFARRTSGVEKEPLDLNGVVQDVVRLLERTIEKSVTIELKLAADLRVVQANRSQMRQTLLNLCVNARDAMPQGGRLLIETSNVHWDVDEASGPLGLGAGDYVLVSVSDTGRGIQAEVREHLFEPFFTTKEQGRGLGLAIVYGIVREHRGAVHVYSEPGNGATFKVYLPAHVGVAQADAPMESALPRGSETVLVVDDEDAVRRTLQRMLERAGYSVLLAEDGAQGLQIYGQQREAISAVIMDVVMPGMSGKEVYQRLKEIDPQVKVLLSSGYSLNGEAAEILAAGAQGFLQKPYDLGAVLRGVRQVLDGR